jgi:hypothetical protein
MPPKRKESAATPSASGPKQKRSKTSFRTPTTAALEGATSSSASEVGTTSSTKNRIVTLRASASGRRGYRSQDLSTTQGSSLDSPDSPGTENSAHPTENTDTSSTSDPIQPIPPLDVESDTQSGSGAKLRPKQKNTTTVCYIGLTEILLMNI